MITIANYDNDQVTIIIVVGINDMIIINSKKGTAAMLCTSEQWSNSVDGTGFAADSVVGALVEEKRSNRPAKRTCFKIFGYCACGSASKLTLASIVDEKKSVIKVPKTGQTKDRCYLNQN